MAGKDDIPFDLQKKINLSISVPPLLMLLVGTREVPGLIKYVDRPDLFAGGILKELRTEFPDNFKKGVDVIEKYLEENPNDVKASKVWNETKRILGMG